MREQILNQLISQPRIKSMKQTLEHVRNNPVTQGHTPPSGFVNTQDTSQWYDKNKSFVFRYIETQTNEGRYELLTRITGISKETLMESLINNTPTTANIKHMIVLWALQEVANNDK